jgi:uncharacterized membrane protein YgcG
MTAKLLVVIVRQPTTASMDKMTEQMAQMVAPVKTTTWGGLHGSLALVLDNVDYEIITKAVVKITTRLGQPALVNPKNNDTTSQLDLLSLQAKTKRLQKEFDLQEAITTIGVQCIIGSVEEQYVEELNKEYFGYANQTIKTIIDHLRTNWCKVMTKERTDATEAFYHAWAPNTMHIITFRCQLTKLQKKCKTINIIISEEAKTLHFVGQMYKTNYFTKGQMTKYETLFDKDKTWALTLQHFTQLYIQQKAYGDNRAANSGFNSMANIYDVPSNQSMASTAPSKITTCDLYIESMEESLVVAREYVTKVPNTPITPDPMAMLRTELDVQQKQFELITKQNLDLLTNMAQNGGGNGGNSGSSGGGGGDNEGGGGGGGRRRGGGQQNKDAKICPHCGKMALHAPADCFSLEANKDKKPVNWK